MASKRGWAPLPPKQTYSSPAVQASQQQQQKSKSPTPPSPPPSTPITLKELEEALSRQADKLLIKVKEEVREEVREEMLQLEQKIEKKIEEKIADLSGNIIGLFTDFVDQVELIEERVEDRSQKVEERVNIVEEKVEMVHNETVMAEYRDMEYAVRIRGLKENMQEKLWEEVATSVANALECDPNVIMGEIEKVYRVNSWAARHKNLPRDVVVYFSRKSRRNQIIQAFYQRNFQVADQNVVILKELPSRILRVRKDFQFLAQELKNRQVAFRWDIPVGIIVTYAGTRYRLNTVQKARDFYSTVLRTESSPLKGAEAQVEELVVNLPVEGKEQRMTRAAHRRLEKELQESQYALASTSTVDSQPVGGARPKTSSLADMRGKLQKLKDPKNA